MNQEQHMTMTKKYLIAMLIGLSGCTNLAGDPSSTPEIRATAGQRGGNSEARFQRYGPLTFMGKYRIEHEWLHEDPRGSHYCHGYDSVREDVIDELGEKRPARMGMDMWEEEGKLLQRAPYFKPDGISDMTRFVVGVYRRPSAPREPFYDHEALCSTAYDGIGSIYSLHLKKTTLAAMRADDKLYVEKRMRYARLLEPLRYEAISFAGIPAERVVWIVSLGLKGMEDKPVREVREQIRVPIGDTGYVYQLTFTLSDTIVQNEAEKAVRRRAYWQRIQDSFRVEAIL